MSKARYMDEEKVIKRGIDALVKELGPVEAIRFLNMPRMKRIEGAKRHRQWQKSLKKDEFFADIFGQPRTQD